MATQAQILANRQNAERSTGPKTDAGKALSSQNSLRHGFRAKGFVVRDDERQEFAELREALLEEIEPRGPVAANLFDQLLHAAWNLHRIHRVEADLFVNDTDPLADEKLHRHLELLARYHGRFERSYHRAYRALKEHQTNQANFCGSLPACDAEFFPVLADVHSIHKSRCNALKAYNIEDFLKTDPSDPGAEPSEVPSSPPQLASFGSIRPVHP